MVRYSAFTNLDYLIRKPRGRGWALEFLTQFLTFCQIVVVDRAAIDRTLAANFRDFEDAVQYETAVAAQLDAIVTRDLEDSPDQGLQILTPVALLQGIAQSGSQPT
jgi:predicted nucleic acid-binding protein